MTGSEKIRRALFERGESLTNAQMRARYGLKKPQNHIASLREQGYKIKARNVVDSRGRVTYKYAAN